MAPAGSDLCFANVISVRAGAEKIWAGAFGGRDKITGWVVRESVRVHVEKLHASYTTNTVELWR